MKHIAIGDAHGRDSWQRVNTKLYEKVIFLGDYADSYTLSDFTILENLKKIITLKKRNPEKSFCYLAITTFIIYIIHDLSVPVFVLPCNPSFLHSFGETLTFSKSPT